MNDASRQIRQSATARLSHLGVSIFGIVLAFWFDSAFVVATEYRVGPDNALLSLDQVPWESLIAGDRVLIQWRKTPYNGKWVLCCQGTKEKPIVVQGLLGPKGELPIIDGRNAITRPELSFWNGTRGIIKIGGASQPADTMPVHILIENLEIRSARPPYQFVGREGVTQYARNAAAIYIEKGRHITIRNCILSDCGNGLFAGPGSQGIVVEGCDIHGNGIEGSLYEHNVYTEAFGITFQANHFGPLRPGCRGNNLKDRSAGLTIRFNWIEGGNRQLDLVDAEDSDMLRQSPAYRQTFVYGNVLVEHDGDGNNQITHYGGDSGETDGYRKGTLFFFHNTVVSLRSGTTTLFRTSTGDERVDCRNNIFFTTTSGASLALADETGQFELHNNWFKENWVDSHERFQGHVIGRDTCLTGAAPGFVSMERQDYRLTAESPCLGVGADLHPRTQPIHRIDWQYRPHRQTIPRPAATARDLGAMTPISASDRSATH